MKRLYRKVVAASPDPIFKTWKPDGSEWPRFADVILECGHMIECHRTPIPQRKHCWACWGIKGKLLRRPEAHQCIIQNICLYLKSKQGRQCIGSRVIESVQQCLPDDNEMCAEMRNVLGNIERDFYLTPKKELMPVLLEEEALCTDEKLWKLSLMGLAEEWERRFVARANPVLDENGDEIGLDILVV